MTAPAPGLPQDVAITLAVYTEAVRENAVIPFTVGHLDSRESALLAALRAAILAAMRAATAGSGAASAASAASAAHVAPPVSASFEAALAALDVEPTHHTDKMITTHIILGLDDVRAAHWAEVDAAVAAKEEAEGANILNRNAVARLSARVAKLEAALTYYADLDAHGARLDTYESNYTGDPADIELDRGDKARAALEDPK